MLPFVNIDLDFVATSTNRIRVAHNSRLLDMHSLLKKQNPTVAQHAWKLKRDHIPIHAHQP